MLLGVARTFSDSKIGFFGVSRLVFLGVEVVAVAGGFWSFSREDFFGRLGVAAALELAVVGGAGLLGLAVLMLLAAKLNGARSGM